MTRNCANCLWGDKCSEAGGCEYYSPLNDEEVLQEEIKNSKTEYEYEYRAYLLTWCGNEKWGDLYDYE